MTLRILAADLSLTSTGLALPDGTTLTLKPGKRTGCERLAWIRDEVLEHAKPLDFGIPVDLVVIEGYAMGTGRQAGTYAIGELGGVIRLALHEAGIPYIEIAPATLKKFATGKGNANKDAVLLAAARAGFDGDNNNEADAWWLRKLALYHYGTGAEQVPTMTVYRDDADAKIAWPIVGVFA